MDNECLGRGRTGGAPRTARMFISQKLADKYDRKL